MARRVSDRARNDANISRRRAGAFCLLAAFTLAQGCATNLTKPDEAPQPTTVKLSTFQAVSIKKVEIAPDFASAGANQKAAKKINELLVNDMRMIFPNLREVDAENVRTGLLIEPLIEEIKFIGGAARFWIGAMAGSSAVLMKVSFRDASTGELIGEPQFYRDSGAYSGAYSMGATDNKLLEDIAEDIVNYAMLNR